MAPEIDDYILVGDLDPHLDPGIFKGFLSLDS